VKPYSYIVSIDLDMSANNHAASGASEQVIRFVVETLRVMSWHKVFAVTHASYVLHRLHGTLADCGGVMALRINFHKLQVCLVQALSRFTVEVVCPFLRMLL
jgi:hypothetical protein